MFQPGDDGPDQATNGDAKDHESLNAHQADPNPVEQLILISSEGCTDIDHGRRGSLALRLRILLPSGILSVEALSLCTKASQKTQKY
jgi:hypothetical protein